VTTPTHILLIEPSTGELAPFSETCCELGISARGPGSIDEDIVCHLGHVDETVSVHVSAAVKNSELVMDEAELDFGLIRFGESATRTLTFRNPGRTATDWSIQLSPSVTSEVDVEQFNFCPSSGTVWPLEMCVIEVTFRPNQCQPLDTFLEIVAADGDKTVIGVTADVQHPQVCLLKSALHTVAYVDAAASLTAVLFNQTALSTRFEWGEWCLGEALVDVDIEPKSGVIEARQKVSFSVSITPRAQGRLGALIVPCSIVGMDEPVSLSVTADVRLLQFSIIYSVSSDKESWLTGDGIVVDFGGNNLIRDVPKRYLRIQNTTNVATHFRLAIESFPSAAAAESSTTGAICEKGPALLKRTMNLADPTAKTGAKATKELHARMLTGGSGVAFQLSRSSGELEAFSEVIIEIMAAADLWGFYSDILHCSIGDADPYNIPVIISIVDRPILFQMVLHNPSLMPIMRFGCVVEGGSNAVVRRTKIRNMSPADIRIDWQTFNVSANDHQLLDLLVVCGKPFPLKDENGKEIIAHCDVGGDLTEDKYNEMSVDEAAMDELAASRPQIISLNVREHDGTEAPAPYSVEPSQSVRTSFYVTRHRHHHHHHQ